MLCVSTRNYGIGGKCRVVVRALAGPVLRSSVVPDQVIHMPSWVNGWHEFMTSTGNKARNRAGSLSSTAWEVRSPDRHSVAGSMAIDKSTIDHQIRLHGQRRVASGQICCGRRTASTIFTLRGPPRGGRAQKAYARADSLRCPPRTCLRWLADHC